MGHDIWGNGELTQRIADRFADEGFVVLLPDMFCDLEPEMVTDSAGVERGRYLGLFDRDHCFSYFSAGVEALRVLSACTSKVGVTGFCEGGNHAFMAAMRLQVDAAVSYYGTHIYTFLDEADNLDSPMILHIAEHDRTYPDEERDRILTHMGGRDGVDIHIYKAGHAFCRVGADEYDPEAEAIAHDRTFELFKRALK